MRSKSTFSNSTSRSYALALYELSKENSELEKIENEMESLKKLLNESSDFKEKNSRSPIFIPFYNLVKNNNAMDWFNGLGIGKQNDNPFKIHVHHIFPKSFVFFAIEMIDSISNLTFLI